MQACNSNCRLSVVIVIVLGLRHYFSRLFCCSTKKHFRESYSIPPKTHWPSTCPRWYFLFPIFDSSICTTFPGPPSLSLFSKIVTSHNSRQNMSQSTAVCDPRPSCCLICHWSSPWHHQYVNFTTSSIEQLDFSNQLPSLMLFSTRCLFFPICLRDCHTKPSERSSHSTQFMID